MCGKAAVSHVSWAEIYAYASSLTLPAAIPVDPGIERVIARDNISRNQAKSILSIQTSRRDRLALADDVIDNSGNLNELQEKVEALHIKYLKLARPLH